MVRNPGTKTLRLTASPPLVGWLFAWLFLTLQACGQQVDDTVEKLTRLKGSINALTLSPDRATLVIAAQDTLHLYHWPDFKVVRQLEVSFDQITCLSFASQGEHESRLLVGGGNPGDCGIVVELAWPGLEEKQRWEVHDDVVWSMSLSPDGRLLASAGHDQKMVLSDRISGEAKMCVGHTGSVRGIQFLNQDTLVSCSEDHSIRTWQVTPWTPRRTMEQHGDGVLGLIQLSLEPSEAWQETMGRDACFSFSQDRTVRYWQPLRGRMVRFVRLGSIPLCGAALEDPLQFVIGDDQGQIHWLDMNSAQVVRSQPIGQDWIESLLYDSVTRTLLIGSRRGELFRLADKPFRRAADRNLPEK